VYIPSQLCVKLDPSYSSIGRQGDALRDAKKISGKFPAGGDQRMKFKTWARAKADRHEELDCYSPF